MNLPWEVLKGVSGTIPFHERPGVQQCLEECQKAGVKEVVIPDETRLARNLIVQENTIEHCKQMGIDLLHNAIPDLFTSGEPEKVLMRMVMGAISQYDYAIKLRNLQHGRDTARAKSKKRTLCGDRKCEGRKKIPGTASYHRFGLGEQT